MELGIFGSHQESFRSRMINDLSSVIMINGERESARARHFGISGTAGSGTSEVTCGRSSMDSFKNRSIFLQKYKFFQNLKCLLEQRLLMMRTKATIGELPKDGQGKDTSG